MRECLKNLNPEKLAKYFDHTRLNADAVTADFEKLCEESKKYGFRMVAINPAPVELCKRLLSGTDVHVGAAIGFPLGQTTKEDKLAETLTAIKNGADEIDYVINLSRLKERDYTYIEKEMAAIVEACKENQVISKVIFENCYLTDKEKEELCRISLSVGPDFIKTSTGFGTGGATAEDLKLMKRMVGDNIQIKAAGGIRTLDTALEYIEIGVTRLGSTSSVNIMKEFMSL